MVQYVYGSVAVAGSYFTRYQDTSMFNCTFRYVAVLLLIYLIDYSVGLLLMLIKGVCGVLCRYGVTSLCMHPSGKLALSVGRDRTLK